QLRKSSGRGVQSGPSQSRRRRRSTARGWRRSAVSRRRGRRPWRRGRRPWRRGAPALERRPDCKRGTQRGDDMVMTRALLYSRRSPSQELLAALAAMLLTFAPASIALAQQTYKAPQEAVDALVAAATNSDQKAALVVLGRDGADIISSGDKV